MCTTVLIGLDLSLRSPACAVCLKQSSGEDQWRFAAFAQRKSDLLAAGRDPRVTIYPSIPDKCTRNVKRYVHIAKHLQDFLQALTADAAPETDVRVYVEGYAFSMRNCGSSYKLHELGGVVQYMLHTIGITNVQTVYPTQWRSKLGLGTTSSKHAILTHVRPMIDLPHVFGQTSSDKNTPNPLQDIADAICIVLSSMLVGAEQCVKKTSRKKRKRTKSV